MISFREFLQTKDRTNVCICTDKIPFSIYTEMFDASNYICFLNGDVDRVKNFRKCFPKYARLIISENFQTISEITQHFSRKGYRKISLVSNENLPECVHFETKIGNISSFPQFANKINNTEIALKLWKTYEQI